MRGNLLDINIEVNITIVNTWETFICLILKVDQLENSTIGELARKPAYFVIGNFFYKKILTKEMTILYPLPLYAGPFKGSFFINLHECAL